MTSANVDLVQMRHTTITRRDGDVFKLNIHVILSCIQKKRQHTFEAKSFSIKTVDGVEARREEGRGKKLFKLSSRTGMPTE